MLQMTALQNVIINILPDSAATKTKATTTTHCDDNCKLAKTTTSTNIISNHHLDLTLQTYSKYE